MTNSSGQPIAAVDRATLLEYFASSPENQADVSASKGGWLINPADGAVSFGVMTAQAATAVLTSEVTSGTVNTADFTNVTSTTNVVDRTSAGTTTLQGQGLVVPGGHIAANSISTTISNLTINLSTNINSAGMFGMNDTVYGSVGGGSAISLPAYGDIITAGGTVHLSGAGNTLYAAGATSGVSTPVTVYGFTAADGVKTLTAPAPFPPGDTNELLTGAASAPILGANYLFVGNGISAPVGGTGIATLLVNVGNVANDSAATMAAAANPVYKVGDIANENVTFFGQDPNGNTVMFHWGLGDVNNSHVVDANAFTGAEILVGVPAASITVSMFH